jgi:hypothetical protein
MDEGVERIRRLSLASRRADADDRRQAERDAAWHEANRSTLDRLETAIPARLRELAAAASGDLVFEDSAYRSQAATAIQVKWRPGTRQSHEVELWLRRDSGSVEWRWTMGHREPPIVHRVPAARFDLARLDDLVAALADPDRWRGGHPPEV